MSTDTNENASVTQHSPLLMSFDAVPDSCNTAKKDQLFMLAAGLLFCMIALWPLPVNLKGSLPFGETLTNRTRLAVMHDDRPFGPEHISDNVYVYSQMVQFKTDLLSLQNPLRKNHEFRFDEQRLWCFPGGMQGAFPLNLVFVILSFITFSNTIAFNLVVLLAWLLCFYCVALLAYFYTRQVLPSLLAGLLYVYAPMFSMGFTSGHFMMHLSFMLPLFMLLLELSLTRGKRRWPFFAFVLFLCAILSGELRLPILMLIYFLLFFGYQMLWGDRQDFSRYGRINAGVVLALVIFALIGLKLFSPVDFEQHSRLAQSPGSSHTFSDFFKLTDFDQHNPKQLKAYRGPVLLSGIFIYLVIWLRFFRRKFFLPAAATFFIVASLGLATPYYRFLCWMFPVLKTVRTPDRFDLAALVLCALMTAIAVAWIGNKLPRKTRALKTVVFCLVLVAAFCDSWVHLWKRNAIVHLDESHQGYQTLKKMETDIILALPFLHPKSHYSEYEQYAWTLHRKPIMNGHFSLSMPKPQQALWNSEPDLNSGRINRETLDWLLKRGLACCTG